MGAGVGGRAGAQYAGGFWSVWFGRVDPVECPLLLPPELEAAEYVAHWLFDMMYYYHGPSGQEDTRNEGGSFTKGDLLTK